MSKYKLNKVKLFKVISPLLVIWVSPYLLWSATAVPLVLFSLMFTLLLLFIWSIVVAIHELSSNYTNDWWVLRETSDG